MVFTWISDVLINNFTFFLLQLLILFLSWLSSYSGRTINTDIGIRSIFSLIEKKPVTSSSLFFSSSFHLLRCVYNMNVFQTFCYVSLWILKCQYCVAIVESFTIFTINYYICIHIFFSRLLKITSKRSHRVYIFLRVYFIYL